MLTCLYFWLIEPLRENFEHDSNSSPAFEIPVIFNDVPYELSLYTDDSGLPEYARFKIPNLKQREIPEDILPILQSVKEHLISCLRITYFGDVGFFPYAVWAFFEEGQPQSVSLNIFKKGGLKFDPINTRDFFAASFEFREEVRLFIHGIDNDVPLPYRYLSLYKILEINFREKGKWHSEDLELLFQPFSQKFKEKGVLKKPVSHLHDLRDKCAHIKTKKGSFAVTELNHREAKLVSEMLPILGEVCVKIINDKAQGKFEMGRHGDWENMIRRVV
jgi:hypothetical protein